MTFYPNKKSRAGNDTLEKIYLTIEKIWYYTLKIMRFRELQNQVVELSEFETIRKLHN